MTKKKVNCHYELLCLFNEKEKNKEKYEKMIASIEEVMGKENVKVEEKDWKPAEKVKNLGQGSYVLIYFNSERKKTEELKKNILQPVAKEVLNRYELLNLTDEKRNKIKLMKKTDKLQPNKDVK